MCKLAKQYETEKIYREFQLHRSISLYDVSLEGHIEIGFHTYVNERSRIDSGPFSKVVIGNHCAIGRNVHITSKTHDLVCPTTSERRNAIIHKEADVFIGSYVWIGDNVIILPGVKIGDYAVIGANSVVTKNVRMFEIVGGLPARHIRFNTQHENYSA